MFNLHLWGALSIWSPVLVKCARQDRFTPVCVCVCVCGGSVVWLRYSTEALVKVDSKMSVLGLLGSSCHSWVAGCPWAVQVFARFHYLWLSIWQVAPPVLFDALLWMSVECAAKDNNSCWQKNTGLSHFALTSKTGETQATLHNLASQIKRGSYILQFQPM